jgi:predicted NUDIX family NTP pyrophosphohydrolase
MPSRSAGILLYRLTASVPEVLLVHPGGPFWARRDVGAWSIPKGELGAEEDGPQAARREFEEELGQAVPGGEMLPLGETRQAGGKHVEAWALAGDIDVTAIKSNLFDLEWPPRSGLTAQFLEVDRAAWFDLATAATKIIPGQKIFLERLEDILSPSRLASSQE